MYYDQALVGIVENEHANYTSKTPLMVQKLPKKRQNISNIVIYSNNVDSVKSTCQCYCAN